MVPPQSSPNTDANTNTNTDTNTGTNTNTNTRTSKALSKYWSRSELCASAGTLNRGFSANTSSPGSKSSESETSPLYQSHQLRVIRVVFTIIWSFQTTRVRDSIKNQKPGRRDLFAKRQNPRPSRSSTFQARAISGTLFSPLFLCSYFFLLLHFFSFFTLFSSVYFFICHVSLQRRLLDPRVATSLHIISRVQTVFVTYQSLFTCHVSVTFHPPCDKSGKKTLTVLT